MSGGGGGGEGRRRKGMKNLRSVSTLHAIGYEEGAGFS